MFTGIIQEIGKVIQTKNHNNAKIIQIECEQILNPLKIGDSIAINGACQTVIEKTNNSFLVYSSTHTLSITNLKLLKNNDYVNLERPLSIKNLLDGHIIQGHIDGTGTINKINKINNEINIEITSNHKLLQYMIDKASIAIEGISLTINKVHKQSFNLNIIPITIELTNLKYKTKNDIVNIEIDIIAKYIKKFINQKNNNNISKNFLQQHGFT